MIRRCPSVDTPGNKRTAPSPDPAKATSATSPRSKGRALFTFPFLSLKAGRKITEFKIQGISTMCLPTSRIVALFGCCGSVSEALGSSWISGPHGAIETDLLCLLCREELWSEDEALTTSAGRMVICKTPPSLVKCCFKTNVIYF